MFYVFENFLLCKTETFISASKNSTALKCLVSYIFGNIVPKKLHEIIIGCLLREVEYFINMKIIIAGI